MITRQQLERLAALKSDEGILSAYLTIDPQLMYDRNQPLTRFKGAVKSASRRLRTTRSPEVLEREGKRVLEFLSKWELIGRGLVIFSSQPAQIWETVSLEVLVPNFVDVDATTKTGILARVLDDYPPLVVAVVQKNNAAIYISQQRVSEETTRVKSEVPGKHEQGGWSQGRFQRHVEFHIAEHLKKFVEEIKELDRVQPFKYLAVGGTEETVNDLLKILPEPFSKKVIGAFSVDLKHETEAETLERAWKVWEAYERQAEQDLVEKAVDAAKAGDQGVVGINDTLWTILEGRVHTLLVTEGLRIEGSACLNCNHFSAKKFERCPICVGEAEKGDVLDRAIEKAFLDGARVKTVSGEASRRLTAEGGIGAVLRY